MRFSNFVAAALCISSVAAAGHAGTGHSVTEQIKVVMAKVRSEQTVDGRTNAAEQLASLTKKVSGKEVTQELVIEITSLLDSTDDSVRYYVATALGNLGPLAKSSAPKLLQLLPAAACLDGAITSASGIRYALIRMGVQLPPPPQCPNVPKAG